MDPLELADEVFTVMRVVSGAVPAAIMHGVSVGPRPLETAVQVTWNGERVDADDEQARTAAHDKADVIGRRIAQALVSEEYTLTEAVCVVHSTPTHATYGVLVKVAL
ncbi:hypothetical protein [Nocardiopsis tropica]|uniref:Uncharacterized protein n=1 Tax=Nocardiopsis tropica TaxID=109330 RepID=A0ABU7KR75_9ACTN|nr:hypothetical protein [Nocardiopsis umidischolae]MEE2051782.1 hypothetical protein [Nocardiopsis umidischolae]